jgi:hypothetical protein
MYKKNIGNVWQYDRDNMDNVKSQEQMNFANGEWIFIEELNRLEFHPHQSGMLIFSSPTHSEFVYLETPLRVLVFPFSVQMKSPYVDQSAKDMNPEYSVRTIFPETDSDLGDLKRLNECFTNNKELVFQDEETKAEKLSKWNSFPYFNLKKKSDKFNPSYSNHAFLLHFLQEDMFNYLKTQSALPEDVHTALGADLHNDFQKKLVAQFLIVMFMNNPDYFFVTKPKDLNQNFTQIKLAPSAKAIAENILSNPGACSEETKKQLDMISQTLTSMANQIGEAFIFTNRSGYFKHFFRHTHHHTSLVEILEEIKAGRQEFPMPRDISDMNNAALYMQGLLSPDGHINIGDFEEQFKSLQASLLSVFQSLFPALREQVLSLDESQGKEALTRMIDTDNPGSNRNKFIQEFISKTIEPVYSPENDETLQSAFEILDFTLLTLSFLEQTYLGAVLGLYESIFFANLNQLPVMQKLKMQTQQDAQMDPETFDWFRRLFVIMGMAEFNVADDLVFVKQKSLKIFKEVSLRLLVL